MRIVGVRRSGDDRTWAAVAATADAPVQGPLALLCDLREFWTAPQVHSRRPTGDVVDAADPDVAVVAPALPEAQVFCIGLNYEEHIDEGWFRNERRHSVPTIFGRWTRSLAMGASVAVPVDEPGLDWEGEVVAWVGSDLHEATVEESWDSIVGYSTFNDLTARDAQRATTQFTLGKNVDRSGQIGPMVTIDECGDIRSGWKLETRVDGEVTQEASTDQQVHDAGTTLSYISRTVTVRAGDLLCTGTPGGVGYARDPAWLLTAGSVVEVEVAGLGCLRTPIV